MGFRHRNFEYWNISLWTMLATWIRVVKLITACMHIVYTLCYTVILSYQFNCSYLQHNINSKFQIDSQKKWNSSDIACVQTKHQQFNISTCMYSTMYVHHTHGFAIQYHYLYLTIDQFQEIWKSEKLMSRDNEK